MTDVVIWRGAVFDGERLWPEAACRVQGGMVTAVGPDAGDGPDASDAEVIDLGDDILAPGYVDLQVNGGDGLMLNDAPDIHTLRRMASAHARLGTAALLPTLITDTPERTRAALQAVAEAVAEGVEGIAGLHLEGPHLSLARKGAHDRALIRPMTDEDEALLVRARTSIPVLKMTIAPESVTEAQVRRLRAAGILLSLGHTNADYATCMAYAAAGVGLVTHLFNAMSPLGHREPGLVGAALDCPGLSAGLIADGFHVHPAAIRAALAAKRGPGRIFLVTDSMAPAGTGVTEFRLNGREIRRSGGRLTLADGTLAGADLDFTRALRVMVDAVGLPLEQALAAATSIPAGLAGMDAGRLVPGQRFRAIRLARTLDRVTPLFPL